jgi:hypothetical protein
MNGKTPTWFKILIALVLVAVLILLYLGFILCLEAWDEGYGA